MRSQARDRRPHRFPRVPLHLRIALGACLAGLLLGGPAFARDFPVPFAMGNPFSLADERGLLPGGHADVGYHHYTFLKGPHDLFSIRQRTAVSLLDTGRLAAGFSYQNHLLVGPVKPGEDPFSIAEWNMNAIQFDYGAVVGVRLPPVLTFEYGRTSQHPLRGGYSEVSTDFIQLSVYAEPLTWPRGALLTGLRFAHVDLYDFWDSPLRRPRTRYRVEVPLEGRWEPASQGLLIVARAWPRILFMRAEGAWEYAKIDPPVQTEIDAEVGIRFERRSAIELVLEFYSTADSEQVRGETAPLTTLGVTARIGTR